MSWNWEKVGSLGSEHDGREWADRNGVDPRDVDIKTNGDVYVRREAESEARGRRRGFEQFEK